MVSVFLFSMGSLPEVFPGSSPPRRAVFGHCCRRHSPSGRAYLGTDHAAGMRQTCRFLIVASYLKIFKQTNKKTPDQLNHSQCFCHHCFEAFECIHGHFQQQKTTDGSVPSEQQKASGTSVSNCLCVLAPPSSFRRGVHLPIFIFFAVPLYLHDWAVLFVSHGYSVLYGVGSSAKWLEKTVWVLALCSLLPQILFEMFTFLCILGLLPLSIFPLLEW